MWNSNITPKLKFKYKCLQNWLSFFQISIKGFEQVL